MQLPSKNCHPLDEILGRALAARGAWDPAALTGDLHNAAFRLFNGFLEGCPDLVVDVYARTLVLFVHAPEAQARELGERASAALLARLPWLQAVLLKTREAASEAGRRGILLHGESPARKIQEQGTWYALDLVMNLDASFYLDTRLLRAWLKTNMTDLRVLNTFAYTGSLGVAALAGGARQVVQLDLNRRFLNLAKDSYALNGFPVRRQDFLPADFWTEVSRLKRSGELFDCVLVDPPFFSQTERGRVDLVSEAQRVINKVRPLVGHNGRLVAMNNALFVSGKEYLRQLEELCADGYVSIEELIPVPEDCAGFQETRAGQLPADPAPFNHSTKIAVLRVRRKDGKTA